MVVVVVVCGNGDGFCCGSSNCKYKISSPIILPHTQ